MKTLALFLATACAWAAWRLTQLAKPDSTALDYLDDGSAMVQTDAEDMLCGVVRAVMEA
ncbi:MAG: hypothetical protein AAGJ95_10390 [Cyanobacteria bacterium J06554_11]